MTITLRGLRKGRTPTVDLGRLLRGGREAAAEPVDMGEIQDRAGEVQARLGESLAAIGDTITDMTGEVGRAVGGRLEDLRERLPDRLPDRLSLDQVPRIRIERRPTNAERIRSVLGTGVVAAAAVGLGALLAFLLDPIRGRARRARARDRAAAMARRTGRGVQRTGRIVASNLAGLRERAVHMDDVADLPNDATLAHKVESVLFRDRAVDKGRINVNAEDGLVVLRGVAGTTDQIRTLEARARDIPGVEDVENLLHLPGTPAPQEPPRYHATAATSRPMEMAGAGSGRGSGNGS